MANKKIINATACESSSITFKSILEKTIYNALVKEGFNPKYEPITVPLWDGFTPITPYYDKETKKQMEKRLKNTGGPFSRILIMKNSKVIGIKYTPDFYFKYKNLNVYIEAKGIENDVFYIKKKMFIKYLDDLFIKTGERSIYFEVYTKRQLYQAIEIIKEYEQETIREDKGTNSKPS